MNARLWTLVRAVLGALAGAVFGIVMVFVMAGDTSAAIGNDGGWALGLAIVLWGAPVGGAAGAMLGGWAAARGPSSLVFRIVGGAAVTLVALAVVLGIALPDNRPKPELDAQGCVISLRTSSLSASGDPRSIAVYDRYCHDGEGHTVNVSILPTINASMGGPGNALVLAGDTTVEAATFAHQIDAMADFRDSQHVEIAYDHRARVLSQTSPVAGFEIVFRPDLDLPRQPNLPPRWVAGRTPPMVASLPLHVPPPGRISRDSLVPYRPSAPGPLDRADADGCTIRQRITLDRYERHVAVYDRDCATTPHRTINVALLAPNAALEGSGNVLVLSIDRAPETVLTGAEIPVTVAFPDARHMEVQYDRRFHVIGHGFPGDSLQITFGPRPQGAP